MSAFREFGIKRVLLTEAALAPKLMAAGWDCYLLVFPSGMERQQVRLGNRMIPSRDLGSVIRKAEWPGKGQNRVRTTMSVKEVFTSRASRSGAARRGTSRSRPLLIAEGLTSPDLRRPSR